MIQSFESPQLAEVTPDEKHWLDERLSELSVRERLILKGLTVYAPPKTGEDMINLVQNIRECGICFGAGGKEELGEFVASEIKGVPQKHMRYIDFARLAEKYMEQHPGEFADGSYIEISEDGLWPCYDGKNLAEQTDTGWSVKLKLASESVPEGVWLRLPDYEEANDGKPDEIRIALDALGVQTVQECVLLDAKCILPEAGNLLEQYDDIANLIYDGQNLGFVLDERGQGAPDFMEKFAAALEYENCHTLAFALDISQNLECYNFILARELTKHAINALQHQRMPDDILFSGCVDLDAFAEDMLEQQGFILTRDKSAYIFKNGQRFVREFSREPSQGMTLE